MSALLASSLLIASVIRQKGESQNGCFKKKHAKFSEKRTLLVPWCVHVRTRIRGYDILVFTYLMNEPLLTWSFLLFLPNHNVIYRIWTIMLIMFFRDKRHFLPFFSNIPPKKTHKTLKNTLFFTSRLVANKYESILTKVF